MAFAKLRTAGYPQTWEFFRNTLLSGGLFTGLFAGVMKLADSAQKEEEAEEQESAEEGLEAPHQAEA